MNYASLVFLTGMVGLSFGTLRGETIAPQPVSGNIQWVYNYEQGKRQAREAGKPLFVVFRCER